MFVNNSSFRGFPQSDSGRKPQNGELHLFISWFFRGKRSKAKTVKIDVKAMFLP
jgi:hypothetical protein